VTRIADILYQLVNLEIRNGTSIPHGSENGFGWFLISGCGELCLIDFKQINRLTGASFGALSSARGNTGSERIYSNK